MTNKIIVDYATAVYIILIKKIMWTGSILDSLLHENVISVDLIS